MNSSLMRRIRNVVVGLAMGALVVVLTPLSMLHDVWSRRRTSGGETTIPRLAASETTIAELLRDGTPIVVEGLAAEIGSPPADLAQLRDVAARTTTPLGVEFNDPANPYFLYTGDYGRTVLHREELSLAQLLDTLFDAGTGDEVVYQLFGARDVDGKIGEIIDDMRTAVRDAGGGDTVRDASGIWVGSPGAVTPIHHDAWPGLLFQTQGRKKVVMFEPADRGKLYLNFPLPTGSTWSKLPGRSEGADSAGFPLFGGARRHVTELGPGDALYIPPFWAHEIEGLTANISVPLRLQPGLRIYLNPGFLRTAAELFDRKLDLVRRSAA